MRTKYPVRLSIVIDWSELDIFGHVNNLEFLKYVQAARVRYWELIELYNYFRETNIGPVLVSVHCDFKKPLHYPGTVTSTCGLRSIKNSSFGLSHRIIDEKGDVAAVAEDVMVLYDFNKREKALIPNWMRKNIQTLETKDSEL
jgi:acyl-CoA thioester hydrolase